MENPKPTTVCLVVRTQAWFTASVVLETIPPLNTKLIDEFPVPAPNIVNLRSWIGKGPCSHKLGGLASLYFDHGEESYPTFTSPSVSPKGASCYAQTATRTLNIDEHTAIFCLEAAVAIPAKPNLMNVEPKNLDDDARVFVRNTTRATKNIVDSLIGGYALYQYPLVWQYIGERTQWMFVDMESKVGTPPFEEIQPDNWIPFKLAVQTKISSDGLLRDGITQKLGEITKDEFRHPLILLKDSMWHTDLRTRFLLQFWIVEYFAEKYSSTITQDNDIRTFVTELEKLIADKQRAYSDYFKSRKGELLRLTLAEKVQACFRTMRIKYDDALFKRAKAVRDSLSHVGEFKENELREMELYIREVVRHMVRRDLELNGIFLNGDDKDKEALEEIAPNFPEPEKRLAKHFGPLQVE